MTKLVIECEGRESLAAVRRKPSAETKWMAERLREALGHELSRWAAKPEMDYEAGAEEVMAVRAAPAVRAPLAPPKPVRVALVGSGAPAADVPPRVGWNARAVWRGGRLVVRAGPLNPLFSQDQAFAVAVVVGAVVAPVVVVATAASAHDGGSIPPPVFLFGFMGALVVSALAMWGFTMLANGWGGHVFVLGRRSLRVASVSWPSRRVRRHPLVWRQDISDVRAGDVNDPNERAGELHAYLRDGERVGFMRGRPREELRWVAWHLSGALAKLPPAPPPDWSAKAAAGSVGDPARDAVPVLPYGRERRTAEIAIQAFPDGGVVITIPPLPAEQSITAIIYFVPAVFIAAIATSALRRGTPFGDASPVILLLMGVAGALLLARLALALARWGQPLVVGIDPRRLYLDDPGSIGRRRQWPRNGVADVRLTTDERPKRGGRYVEVLFMGHPPLVLCRHRGDWDRRRVAAVLRRAAGLAGPPPEHALRRDRR
jgi:hypothetical protein